MAALTAAAATPQHPAAGSSTPAAPAATPLPADTPPPAATAPPADTAPARPAHVTVLLLEQQEQRGSGVLLHRAGGGTWLVTNRHVIDGLDQVCVRTPDGRLWAARPVLPARSSLDLAFLWLADPQASLPVATPLRTAVAASSPSSPSWTPPIVRASGYPIPDTPNATPPTYRELSGLLLPLLSAPLEGGLQLASTSAVRKGMSGGGLFDEQDHLIGINTTHADPLWSAPLRQETGQPVAAALNRRLELVALAIPITRVLPLLSGLKPPAAPAGRAGSGRPAAAAGAAAAPAPLPPICSGALW